MMAATTLRIPSRKGILAGAIQDWRNHGFDFNARMTSTKLVQLFLGVMIAVLVAAGLYTSAIIRERQQSLQDLFRYDVAFTSSQAVIEFERLQNALLELEGRRTPAALAEVKLRFEIIYNRLAILEQGEFLRFTRIAPERARTVADFKAAVGEIDADRPHRRRRSRGRAGSGDPRARLRRT